MSGGLHAGVATAPIPTPSGVPLMGYGARQGVAAGVHDPLLARALHLANGADLLLVVLDVCLVAPWQADEMRGRLAARTGVPRERVLVACSHTHSGPETGIGLGLAPGATAPPHVEGLYEAAVVAGERAVAASAPARLATAQAPVAVGRNRRRADGPVDPVARVLRLDRADGSPLAVLYAHGCHPTALGHDNLHYSADWPGAASSAIERALPGATAIFALAAHADVDPRTRGLQDLARSGQSVGVSFEAMEALGRDVGERVVAALREAGAGRSDVAVGAASSVVRLVVHGAEGGAAGHARRLAERRAATRAALGIEAGAELRTRDLFALAERRLAGLADEERRSRASVVRLDLRDHAAPRFAGGLEAGVAVQALRIGDALFLALPLEATVDVGRAFAERLAGRADPACVLSIGNGWIRYLPHARNFEEPFAERAYEVLTSTFRPEAADRLLDAGLDLAAALGL